MKDFVFEALDFNAEVCEKYTEVNDFLIKTFDRDFVKVELYDECAELILNK